MRNAGGSKYGEVTNMDVIGHMVED